MDKATTVGINQGDDRHCKTISWSAEIQMPSVNPA